MEIKLNYLLQFNIVIVYGFLVLFLEVLWLSMSDLYFFSLFYYWKQFQIILCKHIIRIFFNVIFLYGFPLTANFLGWSLSPFLYNFIS